MSQSRRGFLKAGLMAGAAVSILPRMSEVAQAAKTAMGASIGQDSSLPPEATSGPWQNLRAVKEKKVFDFHTHTLGDAGPGQELHRRKSTCMISTNGKTIHRN